MTPRTFVFAVSVAALVAPLGAVSQPAPAGDSAHVEAFMRMRQALAARSRGDLDECARLPRESIDLGGPPAALRELALVLETRQRWREAAGLWTRYSTVATADADRAAALERREALYRLLTRIEVRVVPALAARVARVWFDHEAPRWYQAGGVERVIEGGRHRVRVEAAGFTPWEMIVPTGFGEPVRVVAVMVPTGDAGAPRTGP